MINRHNQHFPAIFKLVMSSDDEPLDFRLPDAGEPWHLEIETPLHNDDLLQRLAYDEELLQQVYSGEYTPTIRIWRNTQCLVTTVKESRMPNYQQVCQLLEAQGWPVLIRRTGGTCVPQGPGVVNISLIYPKLPNQTWSQEDSYKLLCAPLQQLLTDYGLNATTGKVPGSFCDGRYNLQVNEQKLVGTSQRWRGGLQTDSKGAVLAHACLLVDLDIAEATQQINTLYQRCGNPETFAPKACVALRECVDGPDVIFSAQFVDGVVACLTDIIADKLRG